MTLLSVKQIRFGVLTHAAQIRTTILQSAAGFAKVRPGIYDFVKALTNTFMNFLFAL